MDFAGITEIKIPQGNVEKITETSSGRVLWENVKVKLNTPQWAVYKSNFAHTNTSPLPIVCMTKNIPVTGGATLMTVLNDTDGHAIYYGPYVNLYRSDSSSPASQAKLYSANDGHTPGKDRRVLAISTPIVNSMMGEGLVFIDRGSDSNFTTQYALLKISNAIAKGLGYGLGYAGVNSAPHADNSVYITGSPERQEYLITGLKGGTVVRKAVFSTNALTYYSTHIGRTCWASGMGSSGLYFGALSSYAAAPRNKVLYSADGVSWSSSSVWTTSDNVLGVEYLSAKKKVCAICANAGKIAISSNGTTWQEKDAPFTSPQAYAYSPECDALVVVDKTKAYITQNLSKWIETSIPLGTVNFRDLLDCGGGLFVGYEYLDTKIYFLSIYPTISTGYSSDSSYRIF